MRIAADADDVIEALTHAGFEAYVVGGSVRDHLMGRPQYDTDITTSALPVQAAAVLAQAGFTIYETGVAHGTITALRDRGIDEGDVTHRAAIEVTTFRVDGTYLDNRHPSEVTFTRSLTEDLARRDFTINAMAYSKSTGIIDPFGGNNDLHAGIIRCVGDPDLRFSEDALRIMRALRFSSQLDFRIEQATADSLHRNGRLLERISHERVSTELTRLLCGGNVAAVLTEYADVLGVILPELLCMIGFDQHSEAHVFDVWGHAIATVEKIPARPILRYTALFHDCGKPSTLMLDDKGVGHFPGHAEVGARITRGALERLRLPKATVDRVCLLIANHVVLLEPTLKSMRRAMSRLGAEALRELIELKKADISAHDPTDSHTFRRFLEMDELIDRLIAENACYRMCDLAIKGDDLIAIGYSQGPAVGTELNRLLDLVIEGDLDNDKEQLCTRACEDLGVNSYQ